ncbi:predicted protein [Sclerotinia sclerotiorum 1980 UF-70]|uniref:Uncharacterized protein n=1 Tax=Sclerotinia sclerotiorum (strain ATCC 18683 / 1980 / Ss-1) TaxID=665079 RepID=A7F8Q4_SCLS1|nr:predicted protein [Sclerotinia sclerotiorum 1980 UF-70]EDN99125.1 predicted protein [Sclerotinia sclerotiorum 1980 UF-70]
MYCDYHRKRENLFYALFYHSSVGEISGDNSKGAAGSLSSVKISCMKDKDLIVHISIFLNIQKLLQRKKDSTIMMKPKTPTGYLTPWR